MKKTRQLPLILLSISVLMLVFFVSVAKASNESFVIEPMQEAVENVTLGVSDQVFGNLSVANDSIDFFITNPNGVTVQSFTNVSSTSFNFTASENGTYSMHLNNTCEASNVNVELDYGLSRTFVVQEGLNIRTNFGVGLPLPQPPPLDLEDDEPSDYVIAPYLNFLHASDILETMRSARSILPINTLTLSIVAFAAGLAIFISVEATGPKSFGRVEHMRSSSLGDH